MDGVVPTLRDIAIIVLAVESLVIGGLLIVLLLQIRSLTKMLQEEIWPILESTRETATTVRGTTVFLSDTLIKPLVNVAGYASAANRVMSVLARGKRRGRE
jgi:Flp pilus assembly protein protease CpaA